MNTGQDWVPSSCTLPTADRPLRVAEFDDLLGTAVVRVERPGPGELRIALVASPEVAGAAAALAVRETACCSFFTFTLTATGGALSLGVTVPPGQVAVLDALAARAGSVRS
jgi:hypothetical protein